MTLREASIQGDVERMKLVLPLAEIDINLADDKEATPLHCGSTLGHVEVVKVLQTPPGINVSLADKASSKTTRPPSQETMPKRSQRCTRPSPHTSSTASTWAAHRPS